MTVIIQCWAKKMERICYIQIVLLGARATNAQQIQGHPAQNPPDAWIFSTNKMAIERWCSKHSFILGKENYRLCYARICNS